MTKYFNDSICILQCSLKLKLNISADHNIYDYDNDTLSISTIIFHSLLEATLTPDNSFVRKKDIGLLLQRLVANAAGRKLVFKFIQKEYRKLYDAYRGPDAIVLVLTSLTTYLHEETEYKDVSLYLYIHR
jgi:hypothetical protein